MITYNCYSILEDVRRALNEFSTAYVQGTDTSGKYNNDYLLRKINDAYRQLFALLANTDRMSYLFEKTISLTGVNSVYTLPGDYGALIQFRDDEGIQVWPINSKEKKINDDTGTDREYYRRGNTLVLNEDGVVKTYSLTYKTKARDLTMGQAAAGAATSITLATTASKIVDFYNGQQIENITDDWLDTIDDYATTRVATISETAAADDWYGTVPEIPEPFMHLIAEMAVIKTKAQFSLAQTGVSPAEASYYDLGLADILSNYGNTTDDVPAEEVFEDVDEDEW
jgi:hypothetical protein